MCTGVGQFALDRSTQEVIVDRVAHEVIRVDVEPWKLDPAESFGMTPLDATESAAADFVSDHEGRIGADVAILAVG